MINPNLYANSQKVQYFDPDFYAKALAAREAGYKSQATRNLASLVPGELGQEDPLIGAYGMFDPLGAMETSGRYASLTTGSTNTLGGARDAAYQAAILKYRPLFEKVKARFLAKHKAGEDTFPEVAEFQGLNSKFSGETGGKKYPDDTIDTILAAHARDRRYTTQEKNLEFRKEKQGWTQEEKDQDQALQEIKIRNEARKAVQDLYTTYKIGDLVNVDRAYKRVQALYPDAVTGLSQSAQQQYLTNIIKLSDASMVLLSEADANRSLDIKSIAQSLKQQLITGSRIPVEDIKNLYRTASAIYNPIKKQLGVYTNAIAREVNSRGQGLPNWVDLTSDDVRQITGIETSNVRADATDILTGSTGLALQSGGFADPAANQQPTPGTIITVGGSTTNVNTPKKTVPAAPDRPKIRKFK